MPNVGVIDLNPRENGATALGAGLSKYLDMGADRELERRDSKALEDIYNKYRGDEDVIKKSLEAIRTTPEISNHRRVEETKHLMDLQRFNNDQLKQTNRDLQKQLKQKTKESKATQKAALIADGVPESEADVWVDATPGVQQTYARNHNDLKARGVRKPLASQQPANNQRPTNVKPEGEPDQNLELDDEVIEPEWPEIPLPENTTLAEKEKFKAKNQTENNKALVKAREKSGAVKGIKVRLSLLNQYSEKLPKNMGRIIIDPETGELQPLASLAGVANKETQAYVKTLNDFLSEAKNYFGGRVTNFDVQAFKSRLPGLLNTEEGRRLILKQMELINELEAAHVQGEEEALKHYGRNASYSDIVKIADDRVATKEANIIDRINDLEAASNYMDLMAKNPTKFKDTVLMRDTETGKFKAVDKSKVAQRKEEGWQVY